MEIIQTHDMKEEVTTTGSGMRNYPLPVLINDRTTQGCNPLPRPRPPPSSSTSSSSTRSSSSSSSSADSSTVRLVSKVCVKKQHHEAFKPSLSISVILIVYIICHQSLPTILSKGRNLTSVNQNDSNRSRSLVSLVAANPSPEPVSASARSASSGSHRVPPINGSIFGKRSLNLAGTATTQAAQTNDRKIDNNNVKAKTNNENGSNNQLSPGDNYNWVEQKVHHHHHHHQHQHQQADQKQQSLSSSSSSTSRSEVINYKDIITEMIEDFLALNNESDPEEASVSFCRMIIYECKQMLSTRSRANRGRKRLASRKSQAIPVEI